MTFGLIYLGVLTILIWAFLLSSNLGAGYRYKFWPVSVPDPVSYFSKKFLKYQKNYSVVEKETLGLVLALEHFDVYLGSMPFKIKVYTDHNPLTFLKTMKNKNQRLVRWSLALQEYNLEIQHIPGSENVIADALSRCFG